MTPEPIPVRHVASLECRNCGAGAPVDEHFCPNCSRILALGRHGDYFAYLGLPRTLVIDVADLERRFHDLHADAVAREDTDIESFFHTPANVYIIPGPVHEARLHR